MITGNGKFFVLEGTNGCGKTTQQRLIGKALIEAGYQVYLQNEPSTDMPIGKLLRKKYYSGERKCDITLSNLLIAADRYEQTLESTIPMLNKNINVIQSRNFMSSMSIAYADNCITENPKNITNLIDYIYSKNIDTVKILRPHAILWIDVDIANIRERIESLGESHKDIYESDSYLRYSRKGYEYSAHFLKDHGFDVYQINGNLSQGAVTQAILDIIIPMLESKGED